MGLNLKNGAGATVYRTTTDAQGWYLFEGVAPGTYDLLMDSPDYNGSYLRRLVMPEDAGHLGLSQLTRAAANLQPSAHQVVSISHPTFSWAANPESVSYEVTVREAGTGVEVFSRTGLKATFLNSPVSLVNGRYFWSVLGYDALGNTVMSGGAMFTVQVQ